MDVDETLPSTVPLDVKMFLPYGGEFVIRPGDTVARTLTKVKPHHERRADGARWAVLQGDRVRFWTDEEMLDGLAPRTGGVFNDDLSGHIDKLKLVDQAVEQLLDIVDTSDQAKATTNYFNMAGDAKDFCASLPTLHSSMAMSSTELASAVCKAAQLHLAKRCMFKCLWAHDMLKKFGDSANLLAARDTCHVALLCVIDSIAAAVYLLAEDFRRAGLDPLHMRPIFSHVAKVYNCEPARNAHFYVAPFVPRGGRSACFTFHVLNPTSDGYYVNDSTQFGVVLVDERHPAALARNNPAAARLDTDAAVAEKIKEHDLHVYATKQGVFLHVRGMKRDTEIRGGAGYSNFAASLAKIDTPNSRIEFEVQKEGISIRVCVRGMTPVRHFFGVYTGGAPFPSTWFGLVAPRGRKISYHGTEQPSFCLRAKNHTEDTGAIEIEPCRRVNLGPIKYAILNKAFSNGSARMENDAACALKLHALALAERTGDAGIASSMATPVLPPGCTLETPRHFVLALSSPPPGDYRARLLAASRNKAHPEDVFPRNVTLGVVITKNAYPAVPRDLFSSTRHFVKDAGTLRAFLYGVAVAAQVFLDARVAHNDMFRRNCLWNFDAGDRPSRITVIDTDRSEIVEDDKLLATRIISSVCTYLVEILYMGTQNLEEYLTTQSTIVGAATAVASIAERAVGANQSVFLPVLNGSTGKLIIRPNFFIVEPWLGYSRQDQQLKKNWQKSANNPSELLAIYRTQRGENFRINYAVVSPMGVHRRCCAMIRELFELSGELW